MEVLTIGKSKMKILITKSEVEQFGLTTDVELRDTSESRRVLWNILEAAKEKQGIDPTGDKVLVQLYPMRDGSCELFVTKLGILSKSSQRYVSDSDRTTLLSKRKIYYRFENLNLLSAALEYTRRTNEAFLKSGAVYMGAVGPILEIEEICRDEEDSDLDGIEEFGERLPKETGYYIGEYFRYLSGAEDFISGQSPANYYNE